MRLAIIPARGGSKRIERKNVKPFFGIPIIAYSIVAALRSGRFDTVMVSTDDPEIAKTARRFGAEVPFLRSPKTSDDFATTADVISEVIARYREQDTTFDTFACIYATAPFITAERLADAVDAIAAGNADAAFTCVEYSYPIQRSLKIDDAGKIAMRFPQYANARSQDLEKTYHDAGQFYISTVDAFERTGTLWGPNTLPIILPESEVQDLDTLQDWALAEMKYAMLTLPREIDIADYHLTAYPLINEEQSTAVLRERNHPDVRRNMVNTGEILPENHHNFVRSLITRRDKQYYAVYDKNGALIGSVNLEFTAPGVIERGIWMAECARGKKLAKDILSPLYEILLKRDDVEKIITKVRRENRPSLHLEEALGAKITGEDDEYIYFEIG